MGLPRRFMGGFLAVGEMLTAGVKAEAKWEYEMGRVILGRRKKVLFLAMLPVLLGVGVELAMAGTLPGTIGGSKAYMPTFITTQMFIGSIFVGLMAGLITGCIGAGGGYVLTPALMSIGVKGIMSVGTDQFHLFAKGIMGTVIHKKLGNVNLWMAVWFVIGSMTGVTFGAQLNRAIYAKSPALSDAFISLVYAVILGILGAYSLYDWIRLSRTKTVQSSKEATTAFARWLQAIPLRPRVRFDQDIVPGGRSISVYPLIIVGFIVGFVAAIMGVGGGFLTFPIFVYGLGVSTFTTVGTDILQIIFTTGYSSVAQYAVYGYVFYSVCMGMLLGSLIGVQLGALVTKYVKGSQIRAIYALTILAGFVNRICALPAKLTDAGYLKVSAAAGTIITRVGNAVFFILVIIFSLWIIIAFLQNAGKARASEMARPVGVEQ